MGKYFGTDGIRGIANEELDASLAFRVGRAAAYVLTKHTEKRAKFLIGKDTRISSDMLEAALTAGLCSAGADVQLLGVIPTPAVAYLTIKHQADAGIVISASHNPFEHNGIKIFSGAGYKLSDALEEEIETYIDKSQEIPNAVCDKIGRVLDNAIDPVTEYVAHLAGTIEGDLSGMRVAVDCANGASSRTVRKLFDSLGVAAEFAFTEYNGININDGCGSTHLEDLCRRVKEGTYDLGIAFDGDADRCLVVDDRGEVLDGDRIMAVCATGMQQQGRLKNQAFVATVLSNMGLHEYARNHGFGIECANVGDRYVLEKMLSGGYVLGGEQSGHIIFREFATTGDGELTAVQFMKLLRDSGKKASELAEMVQPYPQVMLNVPVPNALKGSLSQRPAVRAAIENAERDLGDGRILVRPSGTEALVRVMVEGKNEQSVKSAAEYVAKVIEDSI